MNSGPQSPSPVPTTAETLRNAITLHQSGQLQEANRLYLAVLRADPDHAEAHHNLGVLSMQSGRPDVALPHFDAALAARPDLGQYWLSYVEALAEAGRTDEARRLLEQGREQGLQGDAVDVLSGHLEGNNPGPREIDVLVALFAEGRHDDAETLARSITERYPLYGTGWKALGVALTRMARKHEALVPMQRAAELSRDDAEAHNNLGAALQELGRRDEAEASYRQALRLKPDYAEALNNLAVVLKDLGRMEEAEASCRHALRIHPDDAEVLCNLGAILNGMGRPSDAEAAYRQALAVNPNIAEAHGSLGSTLLGLGRLEEAEASCRHAQRLKPEYAHAHGTLGIILDQRGRLDAAEACFQQSLRLEPDSEDVLCRLGMLLHKQLRNQEARDCFKRAVMARPDSLRARVCDVSGTIPILYDSAAEIDPARNAYADALDRLAAWYEVNRASRRHGLWQDVGYMQNFYLAYQASDDRRLQERFGRLTCDVMADDFPEWAAARAVPAQAVDGRLRIGIASAHFRDHSNWKIPVRGWAEHIDRSRFRLFGYHTGHAVDVETERARRSFDHFYDKRPFPELCKMILADNLDVLIYPGLGMDQDTWQMAALRLAPIQCTSWGHPVTSGLPTIDYFLSSDLMEPPDAAEHYSEKLVRLPNLSIHYTLPAAEPVRLTRAEFDFPEHAVLFFCPQSLQKYLPQNDALLVGIALRLPAARFVFLASGPSSASAFLMQRLKRAFARAGLNGEDRLALLPALDSNRFQAMSGIVDVLLDTPDWSGCNSSLELLAHGLPVVTLPGEFMRGRHTLAILRMMGMDELVAATPEAYVDLAVRLGSDPVWRKELRVRIAKCYPRVCGDLSAVRGLEQFLEDAVRQSRAETPLACGRPGKQ